MGSLLNSAGDYFRNSSTDSFRKSCFRDYFGISTGVPPKNLSKFFSWILPVLSTQISSEIPSKIRMGFSSRSPGKIRSRITLRIPLKIPAKMRILNDWRHFVNLWNIDIDWQTVIKKRIYPVTALSNFRIFFSCGTQYFPEISTIIGNLWFVDVFGSVVTQIFYSIDL